MGKIAIMHKKYLAL